MQGVIYQHRITMFVSSGSSMLSHTGEGKFVLHIRVIWASALCFRIMQPFPSKIDKTASSYIAPSMEHDHYSINKWGRLPVRHTARSPPECCWDKELGGSATRLQDGTLNIRSCHSKSFIRTYGVNFPQTVHRYIVARTLRQRQVDARHRSGAGARINANGTEKYRNSLHRPRPTCFKAVRPTNCMQNTGRQEIWTINMCPGRDMVLSRGADSVI